VPQPVVLFEDRATGALANGYEDLADLLALTLGPTQGFVLSHREHRGAELIEDSALAARRIIETPGRASNVGAMLMRDTAWRVHVRAGDGVATSAVLSKAILRGATRYVGAGGNPMVVKRGVERALGVAVAALAHQARPVMGEEHLTRLAQTITGDPNLSLVLGEMLDALGPAAHITVEDYEAPYLDRVYLDGGRWRAAIASPYLITDAVGRRAVLENCRVVLCAAKVETVQDVEPLLTLLAGGAARRLLLVAHEISGNALSTLLANHDRGVVKGLAVSLRRAGEDRANDYTDLSVVTGASLLGPEYGRLLSQVQEFDLGWAHRADATAEELLIRGGAGDPAARRAFIDGLRLELEKQKGTHQERESLRSRLARMVGGAGVLKVGAHTASERESRHQKAEKAIRALQIALDQGVVPGGGAAYLWAIEDVRSFAGTLSGDERQGALTLAQAMEEPCNRIVRNRGGTAPAAAIAELYRSGSGHTYDVVADHVVSAEESGLEDPVGVSRVALETAVSGAMSALTVAVMVLRRKPWKDLGAMRP
jgi:chaperonin GroEL